MSDETVFVLRGTGRDKRYHTSRDCYNLPDDDERIRTDLTLSDVEHLDACQTPACEGEDDWDRTSEHDIQSILERADPDTLPLEVGE